MKLSKNEGQAKTLTLAATIATRSKKSSFRSRASMLLGVLALAGVAAPAAADPCFCEKNCFSPSALENVPEGSIATVGLSPFGNVFNIFRKGDPATVTGIDDPTTPAVEGSSSASGTLRELTLQYNAFHKEVYAQFIYEAASSGALPNFLALVLTNGAAPTTAGTHAIVYLDGTDAAGAKLTGYAYNGRSGTTGALTSWLYGKSVDGDPADRIITSATATGYDALVGAPLPASTTIPYVMPRRISFEPVPAGTNIGGQTLTRNGVRITASFETEAFDSHIPVYGTIADWKSLKGGVNFTAWMVATEAKAIGYDASGFLSSLTLPTTKGKAIVSVNSLANTAVDLVCPIDCQGKVGNYMIPACMPEPTPTPQPTPSPTPEPTPTATPTPEPTLAPVAICESRDNTQSMMDLDARIHALYKITKAGTNRISKRGTALGTAGKKIVRSAKTLAAKASKAHINGWNASWSYPSTVVTCQEPVPSSCTVTSLTTITDSYVESAVELRGLAKKVAATLGRLKLKADKRFIKGLLRNSEKAYNEAIELSKAAPTSQTSCSN